MTYLKVTRMSNFEEPMTMSSASDGKKTRGRRAKVAGTRVIADGNFRPSESVSLGPPIIGEEPRSWSEQILEKKGPMPDLVRTFGVKFRVQAG